MKVVPPINNLNPVSGVLFLAEVGRVPTFRSYLQRILLSRFGSLGIRF